MRFLWFVVGLVVPIVVQGVQDKSSREEGDEPEEYDFDLDHESDSFILKPDEISTTTRPKHHIHPLEMASNLDIPDLCKCFSKIEVSQDCRQKYPDNLRTLRDGSIQMAYVTDDKSLVNSKSLPLIIISSGQQKNLLIVNETLVLVCEMSLEASLEFVRFHHTTRFHVHGKILQDRSHPVHLTFSSISTSIRFPTGSLHLLPSATPTPISAHQNNNNNSTKKIPCLVNSVSTCIPVTLSFKKCASVDFESNSVEVPELALTAENIDLLKLYPEAIKLTSPKPFLILKVFNSRMLTIKTNAITYSNIDVATEVCGKIRPLVEFQGIQKVSLVQNALKLLPCSDLSLKHIEFTHAGITALTNLPKAMLNRVVITHVEGSGDLVPGSICLLADTVTVAENTFYTHQLDGVDGDVIRLGGVTSVEVVEGSMEGVRTCQEQKTEVLDRLQGCQICQVKNGSNSSSPPPHLLLGDTINFTTTVFSSESYSLKPPMKEHLQDKWLLLYLIVAALILIMTVIAAITICVIRKRKKSMSWKVPILPWAKSQYNSRHPYAKSQYNSRHPTLSPKAAYRASREISGKPECYTIFDSIAAAQNTQLPHPPQQTKEKQPIEENQEDEQDCDTYSDPVDSLANTRRDSNIYVNPTNIKGGEDIIDRSAFRDRRLSATTASVASSIANLSVISELTTKDRRKSSYGLLIDITSVLGIESNYKQLTNQ